MRALFHLRPATGAEPHISEVCGSAPTSGASIAGERTRGDAGCYLYAPHVTLLLRIGSGSRAMVYKPHQQNDVDTLKHDDEQ